MATKTVLIDDLDGTEAADSVVFSVNDVYYEIDLSEANARRLKECLEPFMNAGRRVMISKSVSPRARLRKQQLPAAMDGATTAEMNRAIRDWAKRQGMQISDRGRIPETVVEEFNQAHQPRKGSPKREETEVTKLFSHG